MVFTQHFCAACGSEHIRRNSSAGGHDKYQCKGCGHQARFTPAAVAKAVQYAQVDDLLNERNSQRSITHVTSVSRVTIASWIKKAQAASPRLPRLRPKKEQRKEWEALELDEMWTFVGQRQRKGWLWLAVERASRRIVAWVLGRRDAATARRLWLAPPPALSPPLLVFHRPVGGLGVLPRWHHRRCPKGSGGTSMEEAITCSLRQCCGVLVRKSCSFSKSLSMHTARIKIVIDRYSTTLN